MRWYNNYVLPISAGILSVVNRALITGATVALLGSGAYAVYSIAEYTQNKTFMQSVEFQLYVRSLQ